MANQVNLLTTLIVYKDISSSPSTGTVNIKLYSDGSYRFDNVDGVEQYAHSNEHMRMLFDVINAIPS